ncbi:16S rRNA (adenine(1518)-N(6)/adenine(1519)-N(6))-dimethyltransferase RsmA [Flavimarina sp. Hel_I_48]|uniref:16S rRNA (adenine(1518)-N(6)/adenine(1519)-N(6))- dimethyltransferase RsmA n=1 Tax=Flavimarina sp. Hel_I_48 TaxID=1392488 RepID=UPI0004DED459|nr:16S rRNA (adenine(1518)-N(6)/adenine(1519)-N(6))-dimethyltransferase RsmA [Flavimarina sp. Hel_I_48]
MNKNKRFSVKNNAKSEKTGVRAKKHLGQHFLKDENVARDIGNTLTLKGYDRILEIGPGMGVLTKYLLERCKMVTAMELDSESVVYLNHSFPLEHPSLAERSNLEIIEADFLKFDLDPIFDGQPFAITGNFPYNISTQIVFKTLKYRDRIPEFTGMFQKEVAQRICEPSGSKTYGILSVLAQAFYHVEYLFSVSPQVFDPPPKVESGVIRLTRKEDHDKLGCDPDQLFKVVKMAFQQRRKTLRNSLKQLDLPEEIREQEIFNLRPEQLDVDQFVALTNLVINGKTN